MISQIKYRLHRLVIDGTIGEISFIICGINLKRRAVMMRKIIMGVAIFFLLAWHNLLYAQLPEPIGTITFIEGICDIVRNNQEPVLAGEKEPVYVNDRVRTKSYSKLEITFADKSLLRLAPESCAIIEEYNLGDQKRREHSRIQLTRGKIEAVVSKTSAPDTFLVETPNAKGSVKGSDIFVSYLGGKTGVFVQEGAMSILNPSVPEVMAKVVGGNSVLVNLKEAPGEVRPIRDTELSYFKRSVEPAFIKKWMPGKGAAQMKGIIVSLSGTVRLYKKGAQDWREPKLNEVVSEGDKLQTEEEARVKIVLSNGNTIALQPYTEMIFDTLRYDSASGNYENTLAVTKGRLSAVVERTTKQLTFQVKTPTSVCGVRGTFVEVAVTPPAPVASAGVQAAAAAQPTTQVFFEGGSGYVTGILTGQTQEIGAGQNATVDNLGHVSEAVVTPPEQRTVILQTWTSAQTMGSYSTAEGGAGVGSTTQQQNMPPQTPPIQGIGGGEKLAPLADEIKDFLNILSTLDFNTVLNQTLVTTIYDHIFSGSTGGPTSYPPDYWWTVSSNNFHITAFDDYTGTVTMYGDWTGDVPNSFDISFINPEKESDYLYMSVSGNDTWGGTTGTLSGTVISGTLSTPEHDISITGGTISGTHTETTSPEVGTFEATGSVTWVPCGG